MMVFFIDALVKRCVMRIYHEIYTDSQGSCIRRLYENNIKTAYELTIVKTLRWLLAELPLIERLEKLVSLIPK